MFPWYFWLGAVVIATATTAIWRKQTFLRLILGMTFFFVATMWLMMLVGNHND